MIHICRDSVDAASRRVTLIESREFIHATGRRVYSKALFSEQIMIKRNAPLSNFWFQVAAGINI